MATKTRKPAAAKLTTITLPALKKGEHYAGIIVTDGKPAHHLILLPGDGDKLTFAAAGEWAKKHGGELPTSREQSLLFANCKDQFKPSWYWSGDKAASVAGYAWSQHFLLGRQDTYFISLTLRARAVRRAPIQ